MSRWPTAVLALNAAFCDKSSSTRASTWSVSASDTPPMRSEAFSRCARRNDASSLAPFSDNTYTVAPVALESWYESA